MVFHAGDGPRSTSTIVAPCDGMCRYTSLCQCGRATGMEPVGGRALSLGVVRVKANALQGACRPRVPVPFLGISLCQYQCQGHQTTNDIAHVMALRVSLVHVPCLMLLRLCRDPCTT